MVEEIVSIGHSTPEQRRDSWQIRYQGNQQGRKALCEELFTEFPKWQALYPQGSLRDFLKFWNSGTFSGNFFTLYRAGAALHYNFRDEGLTVGDLEVLGRLLLEGFTPASLQAVLDDKGIAGVRELAQKKQVTSLQIPLDGAEKIREFTSQVSEEYGLPAAESNGLALKAMANPDPEVRKIARALIHCAATGENLLGALGEVFDKSVDYRSQLARQGCVVCGYDGAGVQLHHMRVAHNDRSRTHNRLVPLCERHHIARPGDDTDAIHAQQLSELDNDAQFWKNAFIAVSDAAEAVRPTTKPQEETTVPDEVLEQEARRGEDSERLIGPDA